MVQRHPVLTAVLILALNVAIVAAFWLWERGALGVAGAILFATWTPFMHSRNEVAPRQRLLLVLAGVGLLLFAVAGLVAFVLVD